MPLVSNSFAFRVMALAATQPTYWRSSKADEYRELNLLGKGAYGVVYHVTHTPTMTEVSCIDVHLFGRVLTLFSVHLLA